MAATTVIVALASACGDGGGVGPNNPPVADFTAPACTVNVACAFTDGSTDPDGNNTITTRDWDFGDGSPHASEINPSHTFATTGTFNVKLTVTDAAGASSSQTRAVIVSAAANLPPTASFISPSCVANVACQFTDGSSDNDGTVTAWNWVFGDGGSAPDQNPMHTYTAAGTFNVTLTVTDNLGATGTVTQPVTVAPAPAQDCTPSGNTVDCTLDITQRSTVKITFVSEDCELGGSRFEIRQPRPQIAFFNMCSNTQTLPREYTIVDASGAPTVFQAGDQIVTRFVQGTPNPGDPAVGSPQIRLNGVFPTWTVNVDDGGNPTGQGEPDFNDLILTIQATAAP